MMEGSHVGFVRVPGHEALSCRRIFRPVGACMRRRGNRPYFLIRMMRLGLSSMIF